MKFIWIMFIAIVVSFIICDEKWIKFERKNNKIIVHKQENNFSSTWKSELKLKPAVVYKNSDYIRLNPEFKNPKTLRKSLDVDKELAAKRAQDKENRIKSVSVGWDSVTSLLTEYNETKTWTTVTWTTRIRTGNSVVRTWQNTITWKMEIKTWTTIETWNIPINTWNTVTWKKTSWSDFLQKEKKSVKKYKWGWDELILKKWKENVETKEIVVAYKWEYKEVALNKSVKSETPEEIKNNVEKYEWETIPLNLWKLRKVEQEINLPEQDTWINVEVEDSTIEPKENDTTDNTKNKEIKLGENITDILYENSINNSEEITEEIIQDTIKNEITDTIDENNAPEKNTIEESKISEEDEISEENNDYQEEQENTVYYVEKYIWNSGILSLKKWVKLIIDKKIVEPYKWIYQVINLKKAKKIKQESVDINESKEDFWFSEELLNSLLENEEIDLNTLESENDEFLQKVFEETKDPNIMNLILETYISEYQFTKAKKFIENLSETYFNQINPISYLQIYFNSFSLSSNTTNETLASIVESYQTAWKISDEDALRYKWIISLMNKDYDKFFEISAWFTSQSHIELVSKLNGYKNQIKTQMWMPDYYFDTLVALELFNQWFFQPAKVLALSSLTKDANYILPYQVLAYSNFLTNSWDTSIEYLKKLVELDSDNVEKYRFLIWIAYYWNEQYEQSVLMLSQIKSEDLRLDVERYLIRDYIILDQKNKLIWSWSKLLWYNNLVSSDFYTYFYETFYHPYAEWKWFDLYLSDRDLADKMIRVCSMKLWKEERVVCDYWEIGKDIALWKFNNLEQSLLNLVVEYPQWYLYQVLGDYYIKQWDLEKAKVYLLKAISLTQSKSERTQIKKLLQDTM